MIHWREIGTLAKIKAIRSVWSPGYSASQIAANLGSVTRNAIVGIYHRHGDVHLADMPLQSPARSVSSKARKQRTYALKPESIAKTPKPAPAFVETEFQLAGKPLMMLEARECRFPVNEASGDELHLFCGRPTERSYCGHHLGRVFRPLDRR